MKLANYTGSAMLQLHWE